MAASDNDKTENIMLSVALIGVLKIFAIFTGKHLFRISFYESCRPECLYLSLLKRDSDTGVFL